jgi:peroxiredoxin
MIRTLAVMFVTVQLLKAGEYNKVLSVGDAAPKWTGLEGTDGRKHSIDDHKAKACLVVLFTCNSCATSNDYEDRVAKFVETHCGPTGKAALVAINVNQIKDDLMPAMKTRAEKKKYAYPYVIDPTQAVAKAYGATRTPEFFVLDATRKVVYLGAMDDKTKADQVMEKYVEDAVAASLAGRPAKVGETVPRGCLIRYLKK